MKHLLHSLIAAVVAVALGYGIGTVWPPSAVNPDPNHVHADFAVWVNGQKLDFSAPEYMSAPPTGDHDESTSFLIEHAFAHEEAEGKTYPGREYLHLHDGNGHVIHRHKPGLTLGNFFTSIGLDMTNSCLVLDAHQFSMLDVGWVKDFARTKRLCNDGKFHWTFVVNGKMRPMDPGFVFEDGDQILLSYGASDTAWQEEWKEMTNDACLSSQTCPWRGKPPTENCISDPTVPCVGI